MAKVGKAAKSSKKSDQPRVHTSAYEDKGRLDRMEKRFDKDYGFVKGIPPRSPVNSEWERNAIVENQPFMSDYPGNPADNLPYLRKEQALVVGAVHGFGHKSHQMDGALRNSGHSKAHRIGKR